MIKTVDSKGCGWITITEEIDEMVGVEEECIAMNLGAEFHCM